MKKIRFGVLGVSGHFTRRVAAPLGRSEIVEIAAIGSRDRVRAETAARQFGIPRVFDDYDALVRSKDIDAVYIPLPNNLHLEWIRKAADAGKHVLCEKPLAMDASEAKEAADHAAHKGVLLMEAFMYKFHPQWQHVRELVRVGEIGAVYSIHTFFYYTNTDPNNIRNIKAAGGGALMDIGCYAVSVPRFLLGTEPSRVIAHCAYDPVFQTDVLSSGLLDFGAVRTGFTVGTKTAPFQRVIIHGSQGQIEVPVPFNTFPDVPAKVVIATGVGRREYLSPIVDQYQLQFEEFAKAVRGNKSAPFDALDAVGNMRVIDALVRSHSSGAWEKP